MPICIVYFFEIVNIAHGKAEIDSRLYGMVEKYLHAPSVVQPGERIGVGESFQQFILRAESVGRDMDLQQKDQGKHDHKDAGADRVEHIDEKQVYGREGQIVERRPEQNDHSAAGESHESDEGERRCRDIAFFPFEQRVAHIVAEGDQRQDIHSEAKLPPDAHCRG